MASDREIGEPVNILSCPMKMLEKEVFFSEGLLKMVSGSSKKTLRSSSSSSLSKKGSPMGQS